MAAVAMVVLAGGLAGDARRAPASQWSARAAVAAIRVYQATLSPFYGRIGVRCRFIPTCSQYGEAVMTRFGFARGTLLAAKRIVRCGPWTPAGTYDPPPAQ